MYCVVPVNAVVPPIESEPPIDALPATTRVLPIAVSPVIPRDPLTVINLGVMK